MDFQNSAAFGTRIAPAYQTAIQSNNVWLRYFGEGPNSDIRRVGPNLIKYGEDIIGNHRTLTLNLHKFPLNFRHVAPFRNDGGSEACGQKLRLNFALFDPCIIGEV